MTKMEQVMADTPGLIRRARNSFIELHANQTQLHKMLVQTQDRDNAMVLKKNLRLLLAVNGMMEKFVLLSGEDEEEAKSPKAKETPQLVKDALASQASEAAETELE